MSVRNLLPIALLVGLTSIGCTGSPGVVSVTQAMAPTPPIPPLTGGTIGTSPSGAGVASATVFTFLLANTPSGGVPPYTITWDFGDGGAGAGDAPAHTYTNTGDFTAKATVTDSQGKSVQVLLPVSIRSVTGRWTARFSGPLNSQAIDIVQDQTAVTATINGTADGFGSGTGSVSNPRSLSISATFAAAMPAPYAATFIGSLNETLLTWSGTVTGYAGCPCTFTATRQSAGLSAGSSPSSGRR
jgi:hypothetical protein